MKIAVMAVGLPSSGKSYFLRSCFPKYRFVDTDKETPEGLRQRLHGLIDSRAEIALDGCNHLAAFRKETITLLRANGYSVRCFFFPLGKDYVRRIMRRPHDARLRFLHIKKVFEQPSIIEGYQSIQEVSDYWSAEYPQPRPAVFFLIDRLIIGNKIQGNPQSNVLKYSASNLLESYHIDGYQLIGFTNRSDSKAETEDAYHACLLEVVKQIRASVTDILYCSHVEQECQCKWPSSFVMFEAARRHNVNLPSSVLLSSASDFKVAREAGLAHYRNVDVMLKKLGD